MACELLSSIIASTRERRWARVRLTHRGRHTLHTDWARRDPRGQALNRHMHYACRHQIILKFAICQSALALWTAPDACRNRARTRRLARTQPHTLVASSDLIPKLLRLAQAHPRVSLGGTEHAGANHSWRWHGHDIHCQKANSARCALSVIIPRRCCEH